MLYKYANPTVLLSFCNDSLMIIYFFKLSALLLDVIILIP